MRNIIAQSTQASGCGFENNTIQHAGTQSGLVGNRPASLFNARTQGPYLWTTDGLRVQLKLYVVHPKGGSAGHIGEDVTKLIQ